MTIRVDITPPGGSTEDLTGRVLFASSTFTSQVNGTPGESSVQVRDLGHTENWPSGSELRLLVDGVVRWAGPVTRVTRTWPLPVLDTSQPQATPRFWQLTGTDWNVLFTKRVVRNIANPADPVFKLYAPGTHDDTILLDVVNNFSDIVSADGVSLDINRISIAVLDVGGITVGGKRSRGAVVWNAGDYLRDVFASVSRATAGIYYLTPTKVLTYCDVDSPTSSYRLTDHLVAGNDIGYRSLAEIDAGDALTNDALVWGAALGGNKVVFSRVQDAGSIALHGVWQGANYSQGLYKQASADFVADTMVHGTPSSKRGAKDDKRSFKCQVDGARFDLGDKVECISDVFGFDMVLPVRKITWTFPTTSVPRQDLILSYEVDQPWSVYESFFPNIKPTRPLPPLPLPQQAYCTSLDTFDRTSVSGWGTATPGPASWTDTYGQTSDSTVAPSTGGEMTLHVASGFYNHNHDVNESIPHTVLDPDTFFFQFRLDARPTDGDGSAGQYMPSLSFYFNAGAQFRIDQSDPSAAHPGTWIRVGGSFVQDITSVFTPTTWYNVRFRVTHAGFLASYKFWAVGDTEPSSYTDQATGVTSPTTAIDFNWNDTHGAYNTISGIDLKADVKLLGVNCVAGGTPGSFGSVLPFTGVVRGEVAVDTGDHQTYTVTRVYNSGSTVVWKNGTVQRPAIDYTENPAGASVSFVPALAPSDVVVVSYEAAGSPLPSGGSGELQSLIDAAGAGTTLTLTPKEWHEAITVNKALIIDFAGGSITGDFVRAQWATVTHDDVEFRDFTFRDALPGSFQNASIVVSGHDRFKMTRGHTIRGTACALSLQGGTGHRITDVEGELNGTAFMTCGGVTDLKFIGTGDPNWPARIHHNRTSLAEDPLNEGGGFKFSNADTVEITGYEVDHNAGPGIWADIDCVTVDVHANRVHHNTHAGIFFEISHSGTIHVNIVWENGWDITINGVTYAHDSRGDAFGWPSAILCSSSKDAEVYDNVVAWCRGGIGFIYQGNRSDRQVPATGLYAHNNTVAGETGRRLETWTQDGSGGTLFSDSSNRGASNAYWSGGGDVGNFEWNGATRTLSALGNETGSAYVSTGTRDATLIAAGVPTAPEAH